MALAVRTLALLGLAVLAGSGQPWMEPDEGVYLAEAAAGRADSGAYSYLVAWVGAWAGPGLWAPRAINALAGSVAAPLIYRLIAAAGHRRGAFWGGLLVAVWPSLVIWSVLVLKDALVLLALLTALLGGVWLAPRSRVRPGIVDRREPPPSASPVDHCPDSAIAPAPNEAPVGGTDDVVSDLPGPRGTDSGRGTRRWAGVALLAMGAACLGQLRPYAFVLVVVSLAGWVLARLTLEPLVGRWTRRRPTSADQPVLSPQLDESLADDRQAHDSQSDDRQPEEWAGSADAAESGVGNGGPASGGSDAFESNPGRRAGPILVLVAAATFLGVGGVLSGHGFLGLGLVNSAGSVARVEQARTEGIVGDTGFSRPGVDSLDDVIGGIPRGLFHGILGPAPWEAEPLARILLAVELPLWYGALGLAGVTLVNRRWRPPLGPWAVPLLFAAGVAMVIATYLGNSGTALRQRGMIIPIVVGFAATGWCRSRSSDAT
ncbi:MAG: hypothetical protein ACT4OS_02610 [Acidimicrobiales bacterium]